MSTAPDEHSSVTVILGRNQVVSLGEDRLRRVPLCPGFLPDEEGIPSVAVFNSEGMEETVPEALTPNAFDNGIFWNSSNFFSFWSFDMASHLSTGIISRRHFRQILWGPSSINTRLTFLSFLELLNAFRPTNLFLFHKCFDAIVH